jgi:RNAse (barnase) inhibitor barstar
VKKLSDVLEDPAGSGVYLLGAGVSTEGLEKLARKTGLALFVIEGREIRDKDLFLKQTAAALNFPEYFGNNWDAFADCLTDMSWHEATGFVILYDGFDALAEHSPTDFDTALDIFKESSEFWRSQGKAVFVLLRGKSMHAANLPLIV